MMPLVPSPFFLLSTASIAGIVAGGIIVLFVILWFLHANGKLEVIFIVISYQPQFKSP